MTTKDYLSVDKYGHIWDLPGTELCPICWQPDNCGDCDHSPLSDDDAQELGALRGKLHPKLTLEARSDY